MIDPTSCARSISSTCNDDRAIEPQKILVFQQFGSGENKIKGIRQYGGSDFILETFNIDEALPTILDDSSEYLPEKIDAALVLDYLKHPDLSHDLGVLCSKLGAPVVASGKKWRIEGVLTPPTCCGLPKQDCLGRYGEKFGAPELAIEVVRGKIARVEVLRGAPCGATWEAAAHIIGLSAEEAPIAIGLKTQFFCSANPAGWDPIYGKSPVHFAGEVHKNAVKRALKEALSRE